MAMAAWRSVVLDLLLQRWIVRSLSYQSHKSVCSATFCANAHAIVTGPTSGIGKAIATALALHGSRVVLACRSVDRGNSAKRDILHIAPDADLTVLLCDTSSLSSVHKFVSNAANVLHNRVDIFISNAGIFSMNEKERTLSPDGLESHWATNFVCPAVLLLKLLPLMRRSPEVHSGRRARIVLVSSKLHMLGHVDTNDPNFSTSSKRRYSPLAAYAQSKQAEELFADVISQRLSDPQSCLPDTSPLVMTVHPGYVLTSVVRTLPSLIQTMYRKFLQYLLLSPEEGARAPLYCATRGEAEVESHHLRGSFGSNCRVVEKTPMHERADQVLKRMQLDGHVSSSELEEAIAGPEEERK
jgi:NAD(P)-dependent dehydrogenase (short-subunit alcohol dehydrogenase family)